MTDRIEKTVDLRAPVERVWRALTDHVEFGQWFEASIDLPFEVGRRSTGHITTVGAEHYKWDAEVVELEPMRRFSFTWPHPSDPHADDYAQEPRTRVEFRLEPIPDGTRLSVVESGFDAVPPERRSTAIRDNTRGWQIQMDRIRAHVEA